ncbi:hypothetical protein EBBID32_1000 [Sphingobium indicum BiD32]|uniref:Uncharacterized protein n=1 Tax=Sphingobium indicum BiD32 TaxID=1301087 RepID=N1MJE9_9SPHN|nr:hypothetical protein [Sphingobium indicum]CCW15772.1 hypothetical protein EBBID32_1000 [Sphingobium indicum BiD32]
MAFQFKPWPNPEISDIVYELPPMPYGTSYNLLQLIKAYGESVRDGTDDSEDAPFAAISTFKALSLSDVIAKAIIRLHYEHRGLDGDQLVLAVSSAQRDALLNAEVLLADLYERLPKDWDAALRAYRAALLAEQDYDRRIWTPGYEREKAGGPGNSKAVEAAMEQLQDVRCNAEHLLLDIPAPSLQEFTIKYLICFDNDRDMNGFHEGLCAEAKRLLQIDTDPDDSEVAIILRNLNWRAE